MFSSINFKKTIFQLIVVYIFTLAGGFIIGYAMGYAKARGVDITSFHTSGTYKAALAMASLLLCFLSSLLLFILQRTNILEVIALIILLFISSLPNLFIFNYQIAGLLLDFSLVASSLLAAKVISIIIVFIKRKFESEKTSEQEPSNT